MKRLALLAVVIGLVLCCTQTTFAADSHTGVQLLKECEAVAKGPATLTDDEQAGGIHCMGYLNGAADALGLWRQRNIYIKGNVEPPACIPESVTMLELAKVVVKYLNDHPSQLHESYWQLVEAALSDAYPCNVEKVK